MVLDEAEQTAVEDIPALTTFQSEKTSKPEMEKAEAEESREATLTEVVEIAAPKSQYTEVAETPEDDCFEEGEVPGVDDWHDANDEEFKADSVMSQKNGLIDNKLDDGGVRFTAVTDMPEKKRKAKAPIIVQK